MNHRLIYLAGAPGSGKSTLMAKLTEHLTREPQLSAPVAHDRLLYLNGDVAGVELGKQRELFGGTDALPASVIEKAIPWLQERPYELVLAEGARLANKRFLLAAVEAGYSVHLGILNHDKVEEWRAARSEKIGKVQSPAWVKSRVTAVNNLAEHFVRRPELGVKVYFGSPAQLLSDMEHLLG